MLDTLSQGNLDIGGKRANLAGLMKMDRVYPINIGYKVTNNRAELANQNTLQPRHEGIAGSQTIIGSSDMRELSKQNLQ